MKKYAILTIIYISTILSVFYISSLYKKTLKIVEDKDITNIGIKEISESSYDKLYSNINNFAIENNSFILYLTNTDSDLFTFENDLKQLITNNRIESSFVYLNTESVDVTRLITDFSNNKSLNIKKSDIPLFLYFKDGFIYDVIHNQNFDITKVKNKLIELGVIS